MYLVENTATTPNTTIYLLDVHLKNRRLAAILFADIVGYTATMQTDEPQALNSLKKFKTSLETEVPNHQGEIIQFYGDGCLCIFNSSVDAVTCAKALQNDFQSDPKVPVRIGLHAGDIVFREDNVFGDAVNIASRVESMGIPGAVLLSSNVRNQIKNQPNFELANLGKFEFKNVQEGMTVYALANEGLIVPKKENIKGKLKVKPSTTNKRWLVLPFLLLLLLGGYYFFQKEQEVLPDEILESRIAVIPYENNTNDPNLDALGEMAADWIARTLTNLEDKKIVQYDNVKDHLELLKENQNAFMLQTGAEQLVKGKFYQEGNELIFESKIINPINNEVLFALPVIQGLKEKPSEIIQELSQRITGYFVSGENENITESIPPTYEAFQILLEGRAYFGSDYDKARIFFQKAIALDPSFFQPYIFWFFSYTNQGRLAKADSILHLVKLRFPRQKNAIEMFDGVIDGDLEKQFNADKHFFALDPKSFMPNMALGAAALELNKPQTVIEVSQHLNPSAIKFDSPIKGWWFQTYVIALSRLGRYEEALNLLRKIPPEFNQNYYYWQHIYTLQNQTDSLELLIQEMENSGATENAILNILYRIAYDYGAAEDHINQLKWGKRMQQRIQNRPESVALEEQQLANAFFISEDYQNTIATYQALKPKTGESWSYLIHVGCSYAKLGNTLKATAFIQKLQAKEGKYTHGKYKYCQALIYAALGNKTEAMSLLKQAFRSGYGFRRLWDYKYAYELVPLHGYAPFEEFVKPKG